MKTWCCLFIAFSLAAFGTSEEADFIRRMPLSKMIRDWPETSFLDAREGAALGRVSSLDECLRAIGRISIYRRSGTSWQLASSGVGTTVKLKEGEFFLTAAHVLTNGLAARNSDAAAPVKIVVTDFDGAFHPVLRIAGMDRTRDMAWVEIEGKGFHALSLASRKELGLGAEIFSLSATGDQYKHVYQKGIVNAIFEEEGSLCVATSTRSASGWSGSPILATDGRLLAITTRVQPSLRSTGSGRGDSFAESIFPVSHVVAID